MILVLITFSTLLYGAVHNAVLGIVYVTIAAMVVIWAVDGIIAGRVRYSREPLQLILFAAALYGLVQVVPLGTLEPVGGVSGIPNTISLYPFATQVAALHFLGLGTFFSLVCVSLDSAARLRKLTIFITAFGAIYAFFAIIQSVLSPTSIYGLLDRPFAQPFGSFVSRNNFAGWMEMAIALPLGMLFSGSVERDKRLIILTASMIMGVSIALSGSRGGLIALLLQIAFLFVVTYSQKSKGQLWLKLVLGVGIIVGIIAGTAFVGGESTLTRISDEPLAADGIVSRPQIWNVTLRMSADNMPFGVDLGAYSVAYPKYDEASGFERVEQAHDDYLQVVSDAGIVGGLLGLAFLYLLWRVCSEAISTSNTERRGIATGALAGIVGVLIHSLFDFVLHTTAIALLFLSLLGLLAAARFSYPDDDARASDKPRKRRKSHLSPRET